MGVSWSISNKVAFTAGGVFKTDPQGAVAEFDLSGSGTVKNHQRYERTNTLTYPSFNSDATVRFIPYVRSSTFFKIELFGYAVPTSITLNSQYVAGFNGDLLTQQSGSCAKNQLLVSSVVTVKDTVYFGSGAVSMLNNEYKTPPQSCLAVPLSKPTEQEVSVLRDTGSAYCTSYINYRPPLSIVDLGTSTVNAVSTTVATKVTTTTITSTPTFTVTTTTRNSQTEYTWVPSSTVYVYTKGSQTLDSTKLKRDTIPTPTPNVVAFDARQVAKPAIVNGWDPTKISYACKQVATGTTYTSIWGSTTTSFTSTATSTTTNTIWTNTKAEIYTETEMQYQELVVATVTNTGGVATTTTASSCPLQTQASCFYLVGHGAPHIEGVKARVMYNQLITFEKNRDLSDGDIFWLTPSGNLVTMRENDGQAQPKAWLGGNQQYGYVEWTQDPNDPNMAKCVKGDCSSKAFSCTYNGKTKWLIDAPDSELNWYYSWNIPYPYRPAWNGVGYDDRKYTMYVTYEDVDCPCQY
jgi:hypothetical protein